MLNLLFSFIYLFVGIILGISQLFSLFGVLYVLPVAIFLSAARFFQKKGALLPAMWFSLATCLGCVFSFFSWVFSQHDIDPSSALHSWASQTVSVSRAGFPFSYPGVEIPPSPMGGDYVPVDFWPAIFLNHYFWLLVGLLIGGAIVFSIKKKIKTNHYRAVWMFGVGAIVFTLYALGVFALWFD